MDKRAIDACVLMRPEAWHALTVRVGWHYRSAGDRPFPARLLALLEGRELSREEWQALRLTITRKRKYLQKQEAFHLARQRVEHRRKYMRRYMRDRRVNT